jgi:copper chaperone CopZ
MMDKEIKRKNIFKGIAYGLIPHIGCILFVVGAVLGVTVLMQVFKPLLMNRNIFYYLILISLGFATLSSFFYLRKNKSLSWNGIKNKKGYLGIMYGSTIGINILLFFFIFPFLANLGNAGIVSALDEGSTSFLQITSKIPCPGHAPLISDELKTLEGISSVDYSFPNKFNISYDSSITSKKNILQLEIFKEFPAEVIDEGEISNQ